MTDIYDILSRLGVVRKYLGRDYLAYSIRITLQNENYFFLVTKCLYPDVASHFNTNWKRVERDIRTAVKAAWKSNRAYLEELACRPLNDPPKPIEFIDIIVTHLIREKAAAPCMRPGPSKPPAQAGAFAFSVRARAFQTKRTVLQVSPGTVRLRVDPLCSVRFDNREQHFEWGTRLHRMRDPGRHDNGAARRDRMAPRRRS